MCIEQRGHAHNRYETRGRRQRFPGTLALDCTPRCMAQRCRNPDWRQSRHQPRRCRHAKWIAERLGECGMHEAPVNQTHSSDCQQKDHRPVADGREQFREENVLKPGLQFHFRGRHLRVARVGYRREPIQDLARNLSCWVDAIVARVYRHHDLEDLALFATIPVINGLSDYEHPCQAIADILTLMEAWPSFSRRELVYVGDWNNVSRSLLQVCSLVGLGFRAICPEKYGPNAEEHVEWSTKPADVKGADAIYTDVWASMGQEHELAERLDIFRPYQVNEELMSKTGKQSFFMHCLPAHRGQEVTDSVIESEYSLVFQQAANRLPVEKAVLVTVLGVVTGGGSSKLKRRDGVQL